MFRIHEQLSLCDPVGKYGGLHREVGFTVGGVPERPSDGAFQPLAISDWSDASLSLQPRMSA